VLKNPDPRPQDQIPATMMKSLMESKPNLGGTSTDAEEQEQQMAAHAPSHVAVMTRPRLFKPAAAAALHQSRHSYSNGSSHCYGADTHHACCSKGHDSSFSLDNKQTPTNK